MRQKKIYPKKLENVTLPQELVEFLKNTYESILNKEETTLIESDDLLQNETVYGGLLKEGGDEYSFVYFPTEGVKNKWEFVLKVAQIKDIVQGTTASLNLWACTQDNCQSKFMDEDETCLYHDYYDDGKPDPNALTREQIDKIREEKKELLEKFKGLFRESE